MTDEKLRELERRWKQSGSVEDEAVYLLERVRVGDLEQEKLELAAYCGHEGAQGALGAPVPRVEGRLEDWANGLGKWGVTPLRRAVVVASWLVWNHYGFANARDAHEACEAWVDCPCETHAQAAQLLRPADAAAMVMDFDDDSLRSTFLALALSEAADLLGPEDVIRSVRDHLAAKALDPRATGNTVNEGG